MPTGRYALELNQPERLEVSWKEDWKQLTLTLDGEFIGKFETKKELRAGRDFPLPDSTMLHVEFAQGLFAPGLRLVRNGVPLPGSASAPDPGVDPQTQLTMAYYAIFFMGFLSAVVYLVAGFRVEYPLHMDLGLGLLVYSGLYVLLGYLVKRRSVVALAISIALTVLGGAMVWSINRDLERDPMQAMILITPILIMMQAIPAIESLKNTKA